MVGKHPLKNQDMFDWVVNFSFVRPSSAAVAKPSPYLLFSKADFVRKANDLPRFLVLLSALMIIFF